MSAFLTARYLFRGRRTNDELKNMKKRGSALAGKRGKDYELPSAETKDVDR